MWPPRCRQASSLHPLTTPRSPSPGQAPASRHSGTPHAPKARHVPSCVGSSVKTQDLRAPQATWPPVSSDSRAGQRRPPTAGRQGKAQIHTADPLHTLQLPVRGGDRGRAASAVTDFPAAVGQGSPTPPGPSGQAAGRSSLPFSLSGSWPAVTGRRLECPPAMAPVDCRSPPAPGAQRPLETVGATDEDASLCTQAR